MYTRDDVRLDADLYRPSAPGDHPVLLMRQPYGRKIASTLCYAHPAWYAAHGYIVVVQDVRGRGTSEGAFEMLAHEARDGADAVAWAADLPGSTGAVGMYGFSYQGVCQLLAASAAGGALKAIAPAMTGWDMRADWAYENDAFCLSSGLGWAIQLTAETARLAGDLEAYRELFAASRNLPLHDAVTARPDVMDRRRAYVSHYFDWLDQPADSPYWDDISPAAHPVVSAAQAPPALFIGGWYDPHLPGTVAAHGAYARAGRATRLVVGPWGHFPWGRRVAGVDFGESAVSDIDALQVRWFDHWLKGIGETPLSDDPVRLFDVGRRTWLTLATWPTTTESWALGVAPDVEAKGGARVALDLRDGMLAPSPSGGPGLDPIVHDPWRPVTSRGGVFGPPGGPLERTEVDERPDVLTYTSAPLDAPLTLTGAPHAVLSVAADAPSIDLSCVLTRVTPEGRSFHLTEGYRHFPTAPRGEARVPLRPTCITLAPNERLRLAIAGASFPNFPINPGDGASPTRARVGEGRIVTLAVRRDGAGISRLLLPVTP